MKEKIHTEIIPMLEARFVNYWRYAREKNKKFFDGESFATGLFKAKEIMSLASTNAQGSSDRSLLIPSTFVGSSVTHITVPLPVEAYHSAIDDSKRHVIKIQSQVLDASLASTPLRMLLRTAQSSESSVDSVHHNADKLKLWDDVFHFLCLYRHDVWFKTRFMNQYSFSVDDFQNIFLNGHEVTETRDLNTVINHKAKDAYLSESNKLFDIRQYVHRQLSLPTTSTNNITATTDNHEKLNPSKPNDTTLSHDDISKIISYLRTPPISSIQFANKHRLLLSDFHACIVLNLFERQGIFLNNYRRGFLLNSKNHELNSIIRQSINFYNVLYGFKQNDVMIIKIPTHDLSGNHTIKSKDVQIPLAGTKAALSTVPEQNDRYLSRMKLSPDNGQTSMDNIQDTVQFPFAGPLVRKRLPISRNDTDTDRFLVLRTLPVFKSSSTETRSVDSDDSTNSDSRTDVTKASLSSHTPLAEKKKSWISDFEDTHTHPLA